MKLCVRIFLLVALNNQFNRPSEMGSDRYIYCYSMYPRASGMKVVRLVVPTGFGLSLYCWSTPAVTICMEITSNFPRWRIIRSQNQESSSDPKQSWAVSKTRVRNLTLVVSKSLTAGRLMSRHIPKLASRNKLYGPIYVLRRKFSAGWGFPVWAATLRRAISLRFSHVHRSPMASRPDNDLVSKISKDSYLGYHYQRLYI